MCASRREGQNAARSDSRALGDYVVVSLCTDTQPETWQVDFLVIAFFRHGKQNLRFVRRFLLCRLLERGQTPKSHNMPAPGHQKPCPSDSAHSESDRLRDAQEKVPQHSHQMPRQRHPLHSSGLRWPRRRVGRLRTNICHLDSQRLISTSRLAPNDINLDLAQRVSSSLRRVQARAMWRRVRRHPPRVARVAASWRRRQGHGRRQDGALPGPVTLAQPLGPGGSLPLDLDPCSLSQPAVCATAASLSHELPLASRASSDTDCPGETNAWIAIRDTFLHFAAGGVLRKFLGWSGATAISGTSQFRCRWRQYVVLWYGRSSSRWSRVRRSTSLNVFRELGPTTTTRVPAHPLPKRVLRLSTRRHRLRHGKR